MDNLRQLTEMIKIRNGTMQYLTDIVVREKTLIITVNGYKAAAIACIDDKVIELSVGYLFSEQIIGRLDDIIDYNFSPSSFRIDFKVGVSDSDLQRYLSQRTATSGCGGGFSKEYFSENRDSNDTAKEQELQDRKDFPSFPLTIETVIKVLKEFQDKSSLFKSTGGVHSACLVSNHQGTIIVHADDIGRHNAVDKVIGSAVMANIDLNGCTLLTTGRVSFEIINKVAALDIPVLISRSAPTSKSISIAHQKKIYLLGFARGNSLNVYTGINAFSQK